jgi:hypothetical protein
MQIADWISTGGWTDQPDCVHPVFRKLAIQLNDSLPDGERQKLLDLIPRLLNTNTGGKMLSVRLAIFSARRVLGIYENKYPDDNRPRLAIEAAEAWCADPSAAAAYAAYDAASVSAAAAAAAYDAAAYAAYDAASVSAAAAAAAYDAAAYAAYDAASASDAYAADAYARWNLLIDLLDEYDRLTRRNKVPAVDFCPVTEMLNKAKEMAHA